MKPNKFLFAFLFFAVSLFAQTNRGQLATFRCVSDSLPAMNVKVVNIGNEQTAVSNADGEFKILATTGDVLIFPKENYEYKRFVIEDGMLQKDVITVELVSLGVQLDEVVILQDIDGEKMGYVPKGQKRYTPAERKVFTSRSGPVDRLVNAVNGQTKMLKKGVAVERKERLRERLDAYFEDDFYTGKLKIPSDYIDGFKFYAIDNADVVKAIDIKNKALTLERISRLAPSYLELIASEQKTAPEPEKK